METIATPQAVHQNPNQVFVILGGDQKDRWRAWAFGVKEKRAASLSEGLSHLRERNK